MQDRMHLRQFLQPMQATTAATATHTVMHRPAPAAAHKRRRQHPRQVRIFKDQHILEM